MSQQYCYNLIVQFTEWINEKFIEWRGNSRNGVTDFARFVGVSQQVMSNWLNGRNKRPPSPESIAKLAEKFPDIYEVIGFPQRNKRYRLPKEMLERLESAQEEVERVFRERGLTGEMPEAETIAIDIFERHGFKYSHTETD